MIFKKLLDENNIFEAWIWQMWTGWSCGRSYWNQGVSWDSGNIQGVRWWGGPDPWWQCLWKVGQWGHCIHLNCLFATISASRCSLPWLLSLPDLKYSFQCSNKRREGKRRAEKAGGREGGRELLEQADRASGVNAGFESPEVVSGTKGGMGIRMSIWT